MSGEAWLNTGKCSECRRKPYCHKQCRANREAIRRMVAGLMMEKFVERFGNSGDQQQEDENGGKSHA